MMRRVPEATAATTIPATATTSATRNRPAAAPRQPAAPGRRAPSRHEAATIASAITAATTNPSIGPAIRMPTTTGTAITAGITNQIEAGGSITRRSRIPFVYPYDPTGVAIARATAGGGRPWTYRSGICRQTLLGVLGPKE